MQVQKSAYYCVTIKVSITLRLLVNLFVKFNRIILPHRHLFFKSFHVDFFSMRIICSISAKNKVLLANMQI